MDANKCVLTIVYHCIGGGDGRSPSIFIIIINTERYFEVLLKFFLRPRCHGNMLNIYESPK